MLKYLVFLVLCVQILSSQEINDAGDSTLIFGGMVAPTKNAEARKAYNRGSSLMQQNRNNEAVEYFLKAIELDGNYVDAMDHLGIVYRRLGRYDDSEKMYLMSIEINPNNTVPYINLAVVYRFQGRYEDAMQAYLKAQRIDETDPESYYGIGVLYQLAGHYEVSIEYINTAIQKYMAQKSTLVSHAYYLQGDNYYNLGEYANALQYYKTALRYLPNDKELKDRIYKIENSQY